MLIKDLNGKPPKASKESMRDEWAQETANALIALSQALKTEQQMEDVHFKRALLAVEDSLKTRRLRNGRPHRRPYFLFLEKNGCKRKHLKRTGIAWIPLNCYNSLDTQRQLASYQDQRASSLGRASI